MILPVLALGLAGCASQQPARYASSNPYEWRTVSVTPVPYGTAARSGAPVTYSNEPVYVEQYPVYSAPPVYAAPAPVYSPAPVYTYPPVTIGFDFLFTNRHRHHRGYRRW
jgi:hypothetical protein